MKQKGFILIPVILITLIIVIGGYFGYQKYQTTKQVNIQTNSEATPTPPSINLDQYLAIPSSLSATMTPTKKPTVVVKTTAPTSKPTLATSAPVTTSNPNQTSVPTTAPNTTPTASPVSFSKATSCSSVSISGATYGGVVGGKSLYYVASGGQITLTANTTPANGLVNWKIVSFSTGLSSGGSFSTNNNPNTTYTAPTNTSGSDQGVEIRGDISESPDTWLYCPPITIGVHSN